MTKIVLGLLLSVVAMLICFLMLEGVFRFLPVNDGFELDLKTEEDGVFRLKPAKEMTWSSDWKFSIINTVNVNSAGYLNAQEYHQGSEIVAVIGDSFIAANHVPYLETLQGRLDEYLEQHPEAKLSAYSFAGNGAPLSQYLIFAKHVRDQYKPKVLIINIAMNDFDESLAKYRRTGVYHHFVDRRDGGLELSFKFEIRKSEILRFALKYSALARYLFYNLKVHQHFRSRPNKGVAPTSDERFSDSLQAIDEFFIRLPAYSALKPCQIIFSIDYPRRLIYQNKKIPTDFNDYMHRIREAFISKAQGLGYETLDLAPKFLSKHLDTGDRFDFPTDAHWNAHGHGVAFDAVMTSETFRNFLDSRIGNKSGQPECGA